MTMFGPLQAQFVIPNVPLPAEDQDQASGSFKYLLDTTRGGGPLPGELVASMSGLASNGLLQPTAA